MTDTKSNPSTSTPSPSIRGGNGGRMPATRPNPPQPPKK